MYLIILSKFSNFNYFN